MESKMLSETEDKIREANRAYYAGHPLMTDEEYDEMVESSGLLQYQIDQIKTESVIVSDKIKHYQPMTSLPKVKSKDALQEVNGHRIYQLKLDGSSLEVHYDFNGNFDYAASRGDYVYGDNRTKLVIAMIALNKIPSTFKYHRCAVRGELIVSKEDMSVLGNEFISQRSASSGIANRNDPSYAKFLTFIPYDIVFDDGSKWQYVNDDITFDSFEKAEAMFNSEAYPCDGVVVKDYDDDSHEELRGMNYAMAYKFADKQVETRIRDVNWQIGKTGKLTPVAKFDMVFIDAEVTRASLGSLELFKSLDLHYGDKIVVKKANMVIPQVVKNLGGGKNKIEAPEWWNGKKTFVQGQHLYGFDSERWKKILYSQSSQLFGKGVSGGIVDLCVDEYEATTIFDIYKICMDSNFKAKSYGARRIEKLREAVSELKTKNALDLLDSVGIDGFSWSRCVNIAKKAAEEARLKGVSQSQFFIDLVDPYSFAISIDGIGGSLAKTFSDSYQDVRDIFSRFIDTFGEDAKDWNEDIEVKKSVIASVCVTGKLDLGRSKTRSRMNSNGIDVTSEVGKQTDFLVCGSNPTMRKVNDAENAGIKILYCTLTEEAISQIKALKPLEIA
jgi:DNA ligase (NAD+)